MDYLAIFFCDKSNIQVDCLFYIHIYSLGSFFVN